MKKKLLLFFISALLIFESLSISVFASNVPAISAKSAILVDQSGNVLFEKDADERMLIASTTKLMTALVVLENCNLSDTFVIEQKHISVEGSSMYLKSGEEISVRELLYGLLLSSGNDAASALAYHTSGSVEAFVKLMNKKARKLGLENTSFENPHGLDSEKHYSSARDLAVIMSEALKNEEFVRISSTSHITIGGRTLTNHNKLLTTCDGVISGKTGFTKKAGRTLVSCCKRSGMTLICVTLCDPDDWNDHSNLYEWGFSEFKSYSACDATKEISPVSVITGQKDTVSISVKNKKNFLFRADDIITTKTILPKFVYAPVKAGETAGRVEIYINGKYKESISLIYAESVSREKPGRNVFRIFDFGI